MAYSFLGLREISIFQISSKKSFITSTTGGRESQLNFFNNSLNIFLTFFEAAKQVDASTQAPTLCLAYITVWPDLAKIRRFD